MRIGGFVKVRNEIIREGNLYRLLRQLEKVTDGGIICNDRSTDGTREAILDWLVRVNEYNNGGWALLDMPLSSFRHELSVKQRMLQELHLQAAYRPEKRFDWLLWLDGDELLTRSGEANLREFLETRGHEADIWAMHYTQLWRSSLWARTDDGFDDGWFWKIWRYRPDLSFAIADELHHPQFPAQYVDDAVASAIRGADHGRAKRLPFEILHMGNYGKNLAWKAIQYTNSGRLAQASLKRHLYFDKPQLRPVDAQLYPQWASELIPYGNTDEAERTMAERVYTDEERKLFERMGDLKMRDGLVTVIIPTFNRGYALPRTLQSVLAQTYQNWVCVVLDDGSLDHTPDIMRIWQEKDPRFFYCRYPENRGGVAMNEVGMDLASEFGTYWSRLGSDDYWLPHKLWLDVLAFEHGAKFVYGPYRDLHDPDGTGVAEWVDMEPLNLRNRPTQAAEMCKQGGFAASWANVAVHCDVLREVKARHGQYCDPSLRNMEDKLFNFRAAHFTNFTWRGIVGGEVAIGLVGGPLVPERLAEIRYDAIWRIGMDGASAMNAQCAADEATTNAIIARETGKYPAVELLDSRLDLFPWKG